MRISCRRGVVTVVLTLVGLLAMPHWSWGQASSDRIGTVLDVENRAELRPETGTAWKRLYFNDDILFNDIGRTAAESKLKVLLRDEAIMTLSASSEMHFVRSLLEQPQRFTIGKLFTGVLRVVTSKLRRTGSTLDRSSPGRIGGGLSRSTG